MEKMLLREADWLYFVDPKHQSQSLWDAGPLNNPNVSFDTGTYLNKHFSNKGFFFLMIINCIQPTVRLIIYGYSVQLFTPTHMLHLWPFSVISNPSKAPCLCSQAVVCGRMYKTYTGREPMEPMDHYVLTQEGLSTVQYVILFSYVMLWYISNVDSRCGGSVVSAPTTVPGSLDA